jgi:hypothetical protein
VRCLPSPRPRRWRTERITEARGRGWLGEVGGLQETLVALRAKTEHAERLAAVAIAGTPNPLN